MKIVVGTTVVRKSAYVLDKFLENQKKIQDNYFDSELVIATDEIKFLGRLKDYLKRYGLKGEVIYYETKKPDYAKDRTWSISCGREVIRQYALNNSFDYLLSVDADMVYSSSIIQILLGISNGFSVVQSGYKGKSTTNVGFGLSCTLIKKEIFENVSFRCMEFKHNYHLIEDGNMFEYDAFRKGARFRKGVFVDIGHYVSVNEKVDIKSRKISLQKRFIIHPFLRYLVVKLSLWLKYDIGSVLQNKFYGNFGQ